METILSVVLPTFNERDNIVPLIEAVSGALEGRAYEVLVMDDRSPDGTAEAARRAASAERRVVVVERRPPHGLTVSIHDGVERAEGRFVAWMDCDFQHPPELLPELLAPLEAGRADLACASRYVPGGADVRDSTIARWLSVAINRLAQWMIDPRVKDYTTGYVMGRRELLLDLGFRGDYGEYCIDLLATAARRGYRVHEVPYRNVPRRAGTSKTAPNPLGFVRRGWRYLTTILRLWWSGRHHRRDERGADAA